MARKLRECPEGGLNEEQCDDLAHLLDPELFMRDSAEISKNGSDILKLLEKK